MFDWYRFKEVSFYDSALAAEDASPFPLVVNNDGREYRAEERLLEEIEEGNGKRVLVSGRPGSGKSYLVDRLHAKLMSYLAAEIDLVIDQQGSLPEDFVPRSTVPILVRLRKFNSSSLLTEDGELPIEKIIRDELNGFGLQGKFFDFVRSGPRFVFLVDDLDEVNRFSLNENLQAVQRFNKKHRLATTLMAGRSFAVRHFDSSRVRVYQLHDLPQSLVNEVLSAKAISDSALLLKLLEHEPDLLDFLATPFFVKECINYWNSSNNIDRLSQSRLISVLLNKLVFRQRKTEDSEHIDRILEDRIRVTEKVALDNMVGMAPLTASQIASLGDDNLEWLEQMEFISHNALGFEFSNRWIQAVFAARYLIKSEGDYASKRAFIEGFIRPITKTKSAFIQAMEDLTGDSYITEVLEDRALIEKYSELESALLGLSFERLVGDYFRNEMGCQIEHSYRPNYLGDSEVDVFASRKRNEFHTDFYVVECKFRLPTTNDKRLKTGEVVQLREAWQLIDEEENSVAKKRSKTATIRPVLVIYDGVYPDEVVKQATEFGAEIWNVNLPIKRFLGRPKITKQHISRIT